MKDKLFPKPLSAQFSLVLIAMIAICKRISFDNKRQEMFMYEYEFIFVSIFDS